MCFLGAINGWCGCRGVGLLSWFIVSVLGSETDRCVWGVRCGDVHSVLKLAGQEKEGP